jgi:hypothetical protein
MPEQIEQIAQKFLNLETLKTRNSDSLDFHDLAVWQIKAALEAAYNAGTQDPWNDIEDPMGHWHGRNQ